MLLSSIYRLLDIVLIRYFLAKKYCYFWVVFSNNLPFFYLAVKNILDALGKSMSNSMQIANNIDESISNIRENIIYKRLEIYIKSMTFKVIYIDQNHIWQSLFRYS